MRSLGVWCLAACATAPLTPAQQQASCQRWLDGGKPVVYRELHPACGDPQAHGPITDETSYHEAFPCAPPSGVDFGSERIASVHLSDSYLDDTLANMVVKGDRTLVLVFSPAHCGGITPGSADV